MPERNDNRLVSRTDEAAGSGGGDHVRQILVAGLIGAILVMIVIATVSFH